jgi:TonB-dependent receptor-like protein/carboxypeptidase family protein
MTPGAGRVNVLRMLTPGLAIACVLVPWITVAQGLTGALIGTVTDEAGGVISGAVVRISSAALIGGELTTKTDERGQLRFPSVPPGSYALDIVVEGFQPYRDADIRIGAGATIERTPVLTLAALTDSIVVHGPGSRLDARTPGFVTRFGAEDVNAIPMRRFSYQDWVKTAPGISPTSPAGSSVLVSAFGSGVDQNQYLLDGTSITGTGNGVSRADPGVDFIQELQIQSVGASVEYGNVQGAVVNVITKSGGNRFQHDAAYYWQANALTSQPVRLEYDRVRHLESGYERAAYRDFSASLGGPVIRDRLWFFSGYQHLRDADSQPATDPNLPRKYEQDKIFAKLTWRLAPGWQLTQSLHDEFWTNPETPSATKPRSATQRLDATVPAINFGHLIHTASPNTVWDVRVGRFRFTQDTSPTSGDPTIPNRIDQPENVWTGGPQQIGQVQQVRTTVKATVSHYRAAWFGGDHEWRMGAQVDRGEHRAVAILPTGASFIYKDGALFQRTEQAPANSGGRFVTASVFVSDALRLGNRVTINPGLRFDHSRAISQDVPEFDAFVRETGRTKEGRGTVGSWNILSPRVGVVVKLDTAGRTMLRANAGRFGQGLLTGEIASIHPGRTRNTTFREPAGPTQVRDPSQIQLDPELRLPYTNQYSIGLDREVGRLLAVSVAYVRKDGRDFIGWKELAGEYRQEPAALNDGRVVQVWRLTTPSEARLFLLTNPEDYLLTYDGLVIAAERRRSGGWQAFGSYTLSRAYGLQPSSGTSAAGPQVATVGSPPASFAPGVTFGQDPNDLTNAHGRLPNDRPHMVRVMTSVDVPIGLVVAANLQHFSGKPWAKTALVNPNNAGPVLIESRGTRRLSSQTLLDVRISRAFRFSTVGRIELCLDMLNILNDTAEESIGSAVYDAATVGQPDIFIDPRRAMLSVRLNLGR